MANSKKRTDRNTGNYATFEELKNEVLRLNRMKAYSRKSMGKLTGVGPATCSRIIKEFNNDEIKPDLNAMFDALWKIHK